MPNTRMVCLPQSAEYPVSGTAWPTINFLGATGGYRIALAFDANVQETCYWTGVVPQGWTGTKVAVIKYVTSATSGTVEFEVGIEAITPGDAVDLNSSASFDTVNSGKGTVPGTAYYLGEITVTLTNNDSSAAGDYLRISLSRDADDSSNDTAAADCNVLLVEIRDAS